jgi:ABC-type oligopeptide transport system ATPase subunit
MMLDIDHLTKVFPVRGKGLFGKRSGFTALRDVSLKVGKGESFGLVGESGSGKTTLTRCILGLETITSGRILYEGTDLASLSPAAMRRMRSRIQIVFQDPYASLNPRMSVHDIVAEPMEIHADVLGLDARRRTARVEELLALVGLGAQHLFRYPHEFSGGQRQRIGIARALAVNPEFLILDEPTSALDVSVQAQVLNLLHELQGRLGLTYFFISHDLGVIRYICDRVALIYGGEIVEEGACDAIFENPQSDYAHMLLAAMPDPDPDRSPFRQAPDNEEASDRRSVEA